MCVRARVRVVSVANLHSSLSRPLVARAPHIRCDVILWLRNRYPSVSGDNGVCRVCPLGLKNKNINKNYIGAYIKTLKK